MKLYLASSWKMRDRLLSLASLLRLEGHEVDLFCDDSTGRYTFHWSKFVEREEDLLQYDAKSFIGDERVIRAFIEDKRWIDWAEGVVLVLPSGRSAHLEAGYAVGSGKHLWIFGELPKGQFDVMYGFARGLFRTEDIKNLCMAIKRTEMENGL